MSDALRPQVMDMENKTKKKEQKLLSVFRTQLQEMLRRIRSLSLGREETYDILLKSLAEKLRSKIKEE